MKRILSILITCMLIINSYGQINVNDSTVQVVGYWNKNEKQSYNITYDKYKIAKNDTTSRLFMKYVVDITIADSTKDSYLINWYYHDFEIKTDVEMFKKLSSIIENMTTTIKTDEFGAFKEVVNWKEIRDYIYKGTKLLKTETQQFPNFDKVISQIEDLYSTKESIEASSIEEIQQFYTYHGGKYKLDEELKASIQVPNIYGGTPFDADLTVYMDEINIKDNNVVIRMSQVVNEEQLKKETFNYLTKVAETMKIKGPKWEEIPILKNEIQTASRIHDSGWIIYSIQTKEISGEESINVEETTIEIQ